MRTMNERWLCSALAELLTYPVTSVAGTARRAAALAGSGPAAAPLDRFARHAAGADLHELQEAYTAAFDLQPACAPYVGHQLVGDSPVRGPFLARLAGIYAAEGFTPGEELGDHVAEVLRFLAGARETAEAADLLADGLLPAIEKMTAQLAEERGPYRDVLLAVHEALRPAAATPAMRAGAEGRP